ncbi:MAG: S9 family peptidase [Chloroflexi bacterium]|nr:MAG: S9 family peptidase [Chloroflexota bacterium]
MVARGGRRFEGVQIDGDDVLWIEGRPAENGRCVIVRQRDGRFADVIPPPFSARSSVHEYGGGAMLAAQGIVVFSNGPDRRLYQASETEAPSALTPDLGDVRYADMALDRARERVICVVEDHTGSAVVNDLRHVPLGGGEPRTLVRGNDFYSTPRVSPDGRQLCWLTWNQPGMPWGGTELWVANIDADGQLMQPRHIAGGTDESIFQPEWSPDSTLYFVSDRTGWWNLYRADGQGMTPVAPMEAECGRPQWAFRLATYAFLDAARVAMTVCHDGAWRLTVVDVAAGRTDDIELPYTSLGPFMDAARDAVVLTGGGPRDPESVVQVDVRTGAHRRLRPISDIDIDESMLSIPRHITFAGHQGETAHAWYYRPRNDAVPAGALKKPPLLVHAHGGPTSATSTDLDPKVQFWTSRGFAYLDVDYGGSTGYGRAYRSRLDAQMGIVDVGDCVAGARHLAQIGEVDGARMLIDGGSAGGYIVLCAMVFHDLFAAGASYYGIADNEALLVDTHKFEARYSDSLIGPYPECRAAYYERSPVHYVDRVHGALLLLQGEDDVVVPSDQSSMMYDALRKAGIPCAYIAFPGEGHGFRQAANIARSLEVERYFFCRVLGIELPEAIEPVRVANLDGTG